MDISLSSIALAFGLALTGFVAGVINTIAGGASALTIPALIFAGLPPTIANAANRIPVVIQCITSTYGFAKADQLEGRSSFPVIALLAAGAFPGTMLATMASDRMIEWVLAVTMIGVAFYMVFAPNLRADALLTARPLTWVSGLSLFAVGVFGGLIQAGVGLLMLAALVSLMGYDLARANAIKVVAALLLASVALLTFIARGFITPEALFYALMVSIGSSLGAYVGVRLAITRGKALIRYTAAAMAVGAAVAVLLRGGHI